MVSTFCSVSAVIAYSSPPDGETHRRMACLLARHVVGARDYLGEPSTSDPDYRKDKVLGTSLMTPAHDCHLCQEFRYWQGHGDLTIDQHFDAVVRVVPLTFKATGLVVCQKNARIESARIESGIPEWSPHQQGHQRVDGTGNGCRKPGVLPLLSC